MCNHPSPGLRVSRRSVLAGSAAVAAMPWTARSAQAQGPAGPHGLSPDAALTRLMEGNARYMANAPAARDYSAGRAARAQAQHPVAAVLSCSDSRVPPEIVFDQGPGDVFAVRVAGNVINEDGIASLEYAVQFLNVPLVMVLGHSGCGAVEAAIKVLQQNTVLPGHLPELVAAIRPAVEVAQATGSLDLLEVAITQNVRQTVMQLGNTEPILAAAAAGRKIKIVGAVYAITTGKVTLV